MICKLCGGELEKTITNLPFKITDKSIIILKDLPVIECGNCREYLIEDSVMEKIDEIIQSVDKTAELEVIAYAA